MRTVDYYAAHALAGLLMARQGEPGRIVELAAAHAQALAGAMCSRFGHDWDTSKEWLDAGPPVTCLRCDEERVWLPSKEEADPHAGTMLGLCPGCQRTIGHAECVVREDAIWHTSCLGGMP